MAASAPVLGTTQDAPRPIPWTYELTPEDEMEMQTAIEHFSGRTLVGRLVGTSPSRPTVREWIESALGGSTARILELSMMTAGLFLLQLSDSVSTDALLTRSPISSGSRLLVFQRWTPQFDQDEFDRQQQIPRFPVTLSFPSLPIFMRGCIPRMAARWGIVIPGWQMQQKSITVQLMLEEVLKKITKLERESLLVIGSSRTDSGVHAWDQVAQFQTPFHLDDLQSFHSSLNGLLPSDIRVREIAAVPPQFHARYSAKGKIYHYKAYCDPIMDPFQLCYALHVKESLNIHVMNEAARYMEGEHNFQAFANVSNKIMKGSFVRKIHRLDITEKEKNFLFEVEGSGFLYKQVRNMVGLLLVIGKELLPPSAVQTILDSRCRKLLAYHAPTAPPNGLHLMRVIYDEADLMPSSRPPYNSCGIFQTQSKCKLLLSNVF
ncbi:hypothetical protein L7F22_046895 [Adiantum nelumboides]|nr:hypothetical protein [Adiantum nelumboides]